MPSWINRTSAVGAGLWLIALALQLLGVPSIVAWMMLACGAVLLVIGVVPWSRVRPYLPKISWQAPERLVFRPRGATKARLRAKAAALSIEMYDIYRDYRAADPTLVLWHRMVAATGEEQNRLRIEMNEAMQRHHNETMDRYNRTVLGRSLALYDDLVRHRLLDGQPTSRPSRFELEHPTNPLGIEMIAGYFAAIGAAD